MTAPDFMLRHIENLGYHVRLTGDDGHVVFAARDPKTGQKWIVKGSIDTQYDTLCELGEMVGIELRDG
jgi:hypothetical protein